MTENEKFELLAEEFYKETGMLPPGKDDMSGTPWVDRSEAWDKFLHKKFGRLSSQ